MVDPSSITRREYENLIREAITAVKGGRMNLARRLFERALIQNPEDSRAWLWLSGTTDDPEEQRLFLEKAVGADPYNTAAQKGLAILEKKLGAEMFDPAVPEELHEGFEAPEGPVRGESQTYECPSCGGRMIFDLETNNPVCESCGHMHETEKDLAPDRLEIPMGHVMQTPKAHSWAATQHEVACEKCGAHSLESPEKKTTQCPYCGSNQLIESEQVKELVDPQVIALFKIDEKEAHRRAKEWLNKGLFAPDDLLQQARDMALRPAYYPFWTFDGSVEIGWSAEVRNAFNPGTSYEATKWDYADGTVAEFFDDVLIPGVSALKRKEVSTIEPFNLKDLITFDPAHIAGWPAMYYDRPLTEASILAREKVLKQLRPGVRRQVAPGKEARNVHISGGRWTGVTFKHVLLPIWIGTYYFQGQEYHVLVNGQNGKVGGEKPRDMVKVAGVWMIAGVLVIALVVLFIWLALQIGPALVNFLS